MENKKYIVDRIEGKYLVCETEEGSIEKISIKKVSEKVKEKDILVFDGTKYYVDHEMTKNRQKEIEDLTRDLWM